jgi:hypothetical protein
MSAYAHFVQPSQPRDWLTSTDFREHQISHLISTDFLLGSTELYLFFIHDRTGVNASDACHFQRIAGFHFSSA